MKKLLALVLALVMTLSLAVVGSNAAFKDADKVSATYAEAVDVLAGMKVFQGYTDGSFQPEGSITRAEVAAIVYRLYTGDVTDKQASLYATYNKFADMDGASWAKGYIGYCGNAGLVKGYDAKTFGPSDKVTGYQALAMILRAVGYDKNNEFTGADWQLHVAQYAQQLGILKNVKGEDLNAAASRQLVAELLFQTAAKVPCVNYTAALGYTDTSSILGTTKNNTLGFKNFGLTKTADTTDKWGRPCYKWTNGKTGSALVTYATVKATPVATYQKAVAECDVAHDAGLKADKAYTLVVNGQTAQAKYTVNLTDTKTKMGAQGRLFEVYDDTIVMIDTFLAKVTYVADMTYDAQGHLKTPATITLEVYDAANGGHTALTLTDKDANYGYAKGDYVLVNAYTTDAAAQVSVTTSKQVDNTTNKKYAEIVSKATSVDGAQSVIYWNAQQHNVEGTVYDDAAKFYLDNAKQDNGKYTWFFDQYGNLIGNVEIAAATSYGVITKLWWAGNAADGSGVAKADVTYMDGTTGQIDISEMIYDDDNGVAGAYNSAYGVVTHSSTIAAATNKLMQAVADLFYVDPYATENARTTVDTNSIVNGHLFQFITKSNGTVKAMEVSGNGAAISVKDQHNNVVASVDARVFNSVQVAVTKNTQVYGGGGTDPRMVVNDNTLFLIRTATTTAGVYTYSSVKGFTNVGSYTNDNKVDYVDLNKDGVADYVYITSPSATSKVTSVFYFDDAQGAYTLSDGTWVVPGYVDGVAGSIKFANYAALTTLIKDATNTNNVTLTANTLYIVALEDGVVKQGHVVADGETLDAETVGVDTYKLAAAYDKYPANSVKVAYVEGNAGTSANNYVDRDTFDGSLYTDTGATINDNVYYSVITTANDVTKVIGTMGNPAEQNYFFVYVDSGNAANNRLAVQAYAYDKVNRGNAFDAATVTGVKFNGNTAVVSLNANNDAKKDDVYTVTLEQLRDNGYVTVGTFSGKVAADHAGSVTIDLTGVVSTGNTYKVSIGTYFDVKAF